MQNRPRKRQIMRTVGPAQRQRSTLEPSTTPAMEHERQFTTMEHAALTDASDLTLLQAAALLSGSSAWDSRAIRAAGVPSFVMSDGPHGVRRQLGDADHLGIAEAEKATCFPTASALAATWDPDLAREMGEALGVEARGLGVDVLLGPGLNIKRSPLCDVTSSTSPRTRSSPDAWPRASSKESSRRGLPPALSTSRLTPRSCDAWRRTRSWTRARCVRST